MNWGYKRGKKHKAHNYSPPKVMVFLWGGKTCCALIATPNEDNANRRQKKGKS
jgi:hypothetical protein